MSRREQSTSSGTAVTSPAVGMQGPVSSLPQREETSTPLFSAATNAALEAAKNLSLSSGSCALDLNGSGQIPKAARFSLQQLPVDEEDVLPHSLHRHKLRGHFQRPLPHGGGDRHAHHDHRRWNARSADGIAFPVDGGDRRGRAAARAHLGQQRGDPGRRREPSRGGVQQSGSGAPSNAEVRGIFAFPE